MAVTGRSIEQIKSAIADVQLLSDILAMAQDKKKMKDFISGLEDYDTLVQEKNEILKARSEALEFKEAAEKQAAKNAILQADLEKKSNELDNLGSNLAKKLLEISDAEKLNATVKTENEKESLRIKNAQAALDARAQKLEEQADLQEATLSENVSLKKELAEYKAIANKIANLAG